MRSAEQSGRRVLVDTNLLLVLLVGAVDRTAITSFKRTRAYTPDDFDLLNAFVGRYQQVVVTPHVLTEASNLLGQLQPNLRGPARRVVAQLVPKLLEEVAPSSELVAEPLFTRLGLTDAAIARTSRGSVTVLTDDLDLYDALARQGGDVVNFNHVRAGAWEL